MYHQRIRNLLFLAWLVLASFSGAAQAQVSVTVTWNGGSFPSEPGWEIVNTATNEVVMCRQAGAGPHPVLTVLDLAPGQYEVTGWDSFGDGWNSGSLSISVGGSTVFTTSGPPNAGYAPANNNCATAPNDPDNSAGAASLGTFTVTPPLALSLTKTVGTAEGVCAATDSITVAAGTTVYYCYTATNTGSTTLTTHDLVDDQLGTIFSGLNYSLTPGSVIDTVSAGLSIPAVINVTTMNTATWSADGASDSASATVTVSAPTTYTVSGGVNEPAGGAVECLPAVVASGGSSTCTATANPGYVFTGWSGDCSGTNPVCIVNGIAGDVSVVANFAIEPRPVPVLGMGGLMLLSGLIGLALYPLRRRFG